jgi:hypothetical protein
MRIAVLGLYNSGSTALAKCLHRLGVNMGNRFWYVNEPESENNFYEPFELRESLARIWEEGKFVERKPQPYRVKMLRKWIKTQERKTGTHFGAKHPLLALSPEDLPLAWGEDVQYILAARNLSSSVAGLLRRKWFPEAESVAVQETMSRKLEAFFANAEHQALRLDYDFVTREPAAAVDRLIEYLRLPPDPQRRDYAIAGIRSPAAAAGRS